MSNQRDIRAVYDRESIVVYQAYRDEIADAALDAGRFVAPFSFNRMTWIKPSFLWMMERSNWARKAGQERVLAVRITRAGFDEALRRAALTHVERDVHGDADGWRKDLDDAPVRVQWDPERSLRGALLPFRAIQIGLGRAVVVDYVERWCVRIDDVTPLVKKMRRLLDDGDAGRASDLLPKERVYDDVSDDVRRRLGMLPR